VLNGALIGFGNIATRGHVPAYLLPDVQGKARIVAVMDVVEQNRSRAAELLPGAKFHASPDDLLKNEKLDFVDICTPPHTHAEYIRACASRGIHVLCEKPLVEKYDSVNDVAAMIRNAGIAFVPCHQYKYSPLWKSVHNMITSGTLGAVTLAQFNVYRLQADTGTAAWNPQWRTSKAASGGGILVDTGAHYFYLAQYFFGIPQRISAILRTLKHSEYGVEDTALVTLEYPKTLMQINLTWAASQRANSVYIAGEKGSLSYDGTRLFHTDSHGTREIPMPDVSDKNQYIAWYAELFLEFIHRIEQKNYSSDLLDEASRVMKMLDVSYRAFREHAVLEFI